MTRRSSKLLRFFKKNGRNRPELRWFRAQTFLVSRVVVESPVQMQPVTLTYHVDEPVRAQGFSDKRCILLEQGGTVAAWSLQSTYHSKHSSFSEQCRHGRDTCFVVLKRVRAPVLLLPRSS
jgi:hypothetical protein